MELQGSRRVCAEISQKKYSMMNTDRKYEKY